MRVLESLQMKTHRFAAIALVAWYLIVPQSLGRVPGPAADAPLSEWRLAAGFKTAELCHAQINKMLDYHTALADWEHAQCVPSDDPRLKEK